MNHESPPILLSNQELTTSLNRINVALSYEAMEQEYPDSNDLTSIEDLSQCASSQTAEGHCAIKAVDAQFLDSSVFEEKISQVSLNPTHVFSPHNVYAACIFGTIAISALSLVSIVALVLGRDISLKSKANSTSRTVEFMTGESK
ncbi:MAG: hypothetical protein F6K16_31990 [Symploca sp. SIO2B6]|nr:hypothetical protein [Symploca sp. SIO2B6]